MVHIFPRSRIGRLILEIYKSLTDIEYDCRNWETEHNNSVLEITVLFLGIHKWEPDIYIEFSPALHFQCRGEEIFTCSNDFYLPLRRQEDLVGGGSAPSENFLSLPPSLQHCFPADLSIFYLKTTQPLFSSSVFPPWLFFIERPPDYRHMAPSLCQLMEPAWRLLGMSL